MAAYPSSLPYPKLNGYELSPVDQTVRTEMEVGAARQRRRTSDRNDHVAVEWIFSNAEMAAFRTWWDGDAEGGAAWITDVPLAVGDASGVELSTARFMAPWSAKKISATHWTVMARLEVQ